MNLFFTWEKEYITEGTLADIINKIKSLENRRLSDAFSENIVGKLSEDNTFKFSPKWTLGSITVLGFHQDFTYLKGSLQQKQDKVIIKTQTRPNYLLVAIFYSLVFGFIIEVFNFNGFESNFPRSIFFVFFIFSLIFAALMLFTTVRLKNRFERLMGLRD